MLSLVIILITYIFAIIDKQPLSLILVAYFVILLIIHIRASLNDGPDVIIGKFGLFAKQMKVGRISYRDIRCISMASDKNGKHLIFTLKDNEKYLRRLNAFFRLDAKMSAMIGESPFSINVTALNGNHHEIIQMIKNNMNACK